MIKPQTWLDISLGVGDEKLPLRIAARTDGTVMLEVGDNLDIERVDTLLDTAQLTELIHFLTLARDAAAATNEDELNDRV